MWGGFLGACQSDSQVLYIPELDVASWLITRAGHDTAAVKSTSDHADLQPAFGLEFELDMHEAGHLGLWLRLLQEMFWYLKCLL